MHTPFVYKWTHLPTLMWYVGSRTAKNCHPSDGYLCSSKLVKPLILQNPDEWNREIIATGTADEMRELEVEILQLFDARNDPRSFNMHNGDGNVNLAKSAAAHSAGNRGKKLADFNPNLAAAAESRCGKKLADINPNAALAIESRRGKKLADFNPQLALENESRRGKKLVDINPRAAALAERRRGKKLADFNPNAAALCEKRKGQPVASWNPNLAESIKSHQRAVICHHIATGTSTLFESVSQASRVIGGGVSNICKVLTGQCKTCKGYIFRYATDKDLLCHNTQ